MVQAITVAPDGDGWSVKSDALDTELFFRSGAVAEAAARSLGTKMACAGAAVEIQIFLRDGQMAGRFICTPNRSAAYDPAALAKGG
jgi:hypothetical protein